VIRATLSDKWLRITSTVPGEHNFQVGCARSCKQVDIHLDAFEDYRPIFEALRPFFATKATETTREPTVTVDGFETVKRAGVPDESKG
jgi:hypothetical protein